MTTVLVCDDAPQQRQTIVRAVSAIPGVERVTAAGSGEEVIARFPIERPDLVLMDIHLAVDTARSQIVLYPGCLYPFDRRQYRTRNHFLWIKESAMPPGTQLTQD